MADRDPPLNVRPDRDARAAVLADLATRERDGHKLDMTQLVNAFFAAYLANPEAVLGILNEHWPAPKTKGRPRTGDGPKRDTRKSAPAPKAQPAVEAPTFVAPVAEPAQQPRKWAGRPALPFNPPKR